MPSSLFAGETQPLSPEFVTQEIAKIRKYDIYDSSIIMMEKNARDFELRLSEMQEKFRNSNPDQRQWVQQTIEALGKGQKDLSDLLGLIHSQLKDPAVDPDILRFEIRGRLNALDIDLATAKGIPDFIVSNNQVASALGNKSKIGSQGPLDSAAVSETQSGKSSNAPLPSSFWQSGYNNSQFAVQAPSAQ